MRRELILFLFSFLAPLVTAQDAAAAAAAAPGGTTTKKPTEAEVAEYKQDFIDFDLNKDDQIDPQEIRAQFKGELDPKELYQFFQDVDKDDTGTVTLQEYIDYAVTLS